MKFRFAPMNFEKALEIVKWRYESPYDIYNVVTDNAGEEAAYFADSANRYYVIKTDEHGLTAFCCFGAEGQVPGGNYSAQALDIGVGMRPDLTGKGLGSTLVDSILQFAIQSFQLTAFRATIATFNKRSQRVFEKAGFESVQIFTKRGTDRQFIVMMRFITDSTMAKE